MKRLLTFTVAFILSISTVYGESFQDFQKNLSNEFLSFRDNGFKEYKKRIDEEFRLYKKILNEEFEKYKREIGKYWSQPVLPSQKVFVQYSKDFRKRTIVDFQNSTIKVEILNPGNNYKKQLKEALKEIVVEDVKTAFNKNPVFVNVEKRLKKRKLKNIALSKVKKEKIVGDVLTGKENISNHEADRIAENILKKGKIKKLREKKGRKKIVLTYSFPKNRIVIKAKKYRDIVHRYSKRYRIDVPLIFSIIHTESSFNPMAVSHIPAYGLMQIVPQTAGRDVTKNIFGKPMLLTPSYLFNSENNINIGSGYLYLLYYKYFAGVKNPKSRLFCSIAAYNGGPGGVARAFTGTTNLRRAIKVINRMSPEQVYETLRKRLPMRETREYLRKVYSKIYLYKNF
ncbi:murein transglycosylase domain-containing protein [Desulfurobacterium atlanticum]|uniref:Membrane-bound lytic murein transglycosylase C n=1 Tax=Desulfurobacterium atlanticum TaxID=240169 RepID=A0A238YY12_9BACT|nr:murein transglycosylase domain-containing protein [Desulfurobacterium atlanticum]SNR75544.1 membrane-bound lytic murein transglycosylase C [Desulfurobacterium atlanticum]